MPHIHRGSIVFAATTIVMVKKLVLYPELLGLKPEEDVDHEEQEMADPDGGDASAQAKKPAISAGR